ncbi:MAG: carbohydrate kinase family protein [Methanobacteriaceae archaeon]|nr:carbohydrate kinase family protein [Methanobacteriaceae archaeon]
MNNKLDLLVLGHTALDYIMQVDTFSKPNTSTLINDLETFNGGAANNVAVSSATFGLNVGLISCVGSDFIGSDYEKILLDLNIDISEMIQSKTARTPRAFVLTNKDDEQSFYFYWGAAEMYEKSPIPKEIINRSTAVHLATGDPQYNIKAGEYAHLENKLVSFDPGQDLHLYKSDDLRRILPNCNILFGNEHEIDYILNLLETTIEEIHENGTEIVVKTCGDKGSIIYPKNEEPINIEPVKVKADDPTGAGDSYKAGFLTMYIKENDLKTCGRFASTVSSYIVQTRGCQTNIPHLEQVLEKMEEIW